MLACTHPQNVHLTFAQKWWSSGAGHTKTAVYLVMGKSSPNDPDPYKQQSVILVPANAPGIKLKRMMSVFGYDDAPHGHGHFVFENVRVPASNMIVGEGRGFEIIQGRLGPGRIHHAMRAIGVVSGWGLCHPFFQTIFYADLLSCTHFMFPIYSS
jgi:acyl-CoA dehydrogenase